MFKRKKHTETTAEIKAKKIKLGIGIVSLETTFPQLLKLISYLAIVALILSSGFAIKTSCFSIEKKPGHLPGLRGERAYNGYMPDKP